MGARESGEAIIGVNGTRDQTVRAIRGWTRGDNSYNLQRQRVKKKNIYNTCLLASLLFVVSILFSLDPK